MLIFGQAIVHYNLNQKYTYILELDGGTYVSQVVSDGIEQSIENWIAELNRKEVTSNAFSAIIIEQIMTQLLDPTFGLILLKELKNVWYNDLETDLGRGHIHVVLTEENSYQHNT